MLLYVMRHGDAIQFARTDAERPLSPLGQRQAARMVGHIRDALPSRVIASPYLRAQQTCGIVCEGLGIAQFDTINGITPDNDPLAVMRLLQEYEQHTLLMVSHQPLVSALVALLVDGDINGGYSMGTASVACLQLDQVGPGQGQLKWLRHAG